MPKMKTHKASKKRFGATANGKLKRSQAGKKHLNSPKSRKRKRQLRGNVVETGRVARKYVKLLGAKVKHDKLRRQAEETQPQTEKSANQE